MIEELSVAEIIVIVVIILMLLCCMSIIVYYNYKASVTAFTYQVCKTNKAPFPVPVCCPSCLFPRGTQSESEQPAPDYSHDNESEPPYVPPPKRPEYYTETHS